MPVTERVSGTEGEWAPWGARAPSALASHDAACCRDARAWFLAMDRSLWRGRGAPGWIGRHYDWGPTCWPIHWCEAVGAKSLCCGAQAALTVEAFQARGVEAVPAQLVQRYPAQDTRQWHRRWAESGADPAWAADGLVYHEVVVVLEGDRARVWNPTGTEWVPPEMFRVDGRGSVAAIRVGGPAPTGRVVAWGEVELPLGTWASPARTPAGA